MMDMTRGLGPVSAASLFNILGLLSVEYAQRDPRYGHEVTSRDSIDVIVFDLRSQAYRMLIHEGQNEVSREQDSGLTELRPFAHEHNGFLEWTTLSSLILREGSSSLSDLSTSFWEHDQLIEPVQQRKTSRLVLEWKQHRHHLAMVFLTTLLRKLIQETSRLWCPGTAKLTSPWTKLRTVDESRVQTLLRHISWSVLGLVASMRRDNIFIPVEICWKLPVFEYVRFIVCLGI